MKAIYTDNAALLEALTENGINITCDEQIRMIISDEDAARLPELVESIAPAAVGDYSLETINAEPKNRQADMKKTYRIVAKCVPYNAKMHHHGEKVIRRDGATPVEWLHDDREGLTLKEANALLLDYAKETAGQYIPNWGLAVIHLERYTGGVASCGTHQDGTRYLNDDTMTYYVEAE